jgi:replication factor A1
MSPQPLSFSFIHSPTHPILLITNPTTLLSPQVVLSDGSHFVQGMLGTQLNHTIRDKALETNALIRLEEFMNNNIQGRTVIIVLKMTILENPGQRIGNPVDLEKAGAAPATAPAVTAKPLYNSTNGTGGAGTEPKVDNSYGNSNSSSNNNNTYGSSSNSNNQASPSHNPYGARSHAAPQHAPIVRGQAASSSNNASHITPIAQLNMYQNKWVIKARVTSKSDIRTWSNAKGEGSLFSIELLDSSGMDVRATLFKEAVDKFYHMLEVSKVYTLTGGRLKVANMQYNTCKSNFEITFDQNSEIHLDNDTGDIEKQIYEFCKIADLEAIEANKNVDILAIVKTVGDPVNIIAKKTGNELTKCDLTLVDDSQVEVNLTLWGEKANRAPNEYAGSPVVAFRRARVSDYGGKSLSGGDGIDVNPDIPEAGPLQSWWTASGSSGSAARSLSSSGGGAGKIDSLKERKNIATIKNDNLGYTNPDKPDWLSFKATITFIKKDKEGGAWYPACANSGEPCKNRFKVTQTTDGQWYCDKCQGTYQNCIRRWIFSGVVEDGTSSTWVSFFNEQAESLFSGATADDVYNKTYAGDGHDQDAYDSYFARASFSECIFKCKVKNEMVNDESRVKTSVYSLHPVDYVKESKDLLAAIEQF